MARKETGFNISQNQALRDVLKITKMSQAEFGRKLDVVRQHINGIYHDTAVITMKIVLYIIDNHPDIAIKYGFIHDRLSEPEAEYQTKNNDMNVLQEQLFNAIKSIGRIEMTMEKQQNEIDQLHSEIENMKSKQRVKTA